MPPMACTFARPSTPAATARGQRHARGLTLVEAMSMLLAVGLVAALALPKMVEQQSRGRSAKLRTTAQALQVVSTVVRGMATSQVDDCRDPTPHTLTLDGEPIALRHCQPLPVADFDQGLLAAARVSPADGWRLAPSTADRLVIELGEAPQPARCAITFSAAGPDQPATVSTLTDGC